MDHTSDPFAVRYIFDPERLDLAREFRDNINGPHSRDLQQLLVRMRWGPVEGRYVLLVLEPGKRWRLGRLPPKRGQKVELFDDVEFTSLADAEWHVFKLRWEALAGAPLSIGASK
ncbi:hypothetical protein [Mesorhizobium sp. ANAO-SY3R2]|uniref:hypothetical protein n=1 Tax=Mesorhizobium sp. ANAO-SY3R2 TaxID=3166644 RepID=UPI00366AACAF